ncbi:nucleoside hydrolase [Candidatus Aerophobetes bacterium]|nr:nucleoside hydrolase [Candidatus Aerophobetes bacterium]
MKEVPFIVGGRVEPPYFVGREEELTKLISDAQTLSQNNLILAPRRFGKTCLLHNVKIRAEEKKSLIIPELRVYMDFYNRNEGLDGCYLHDPLTVGFAINPAFCEIEQYHIDVETGGEIARGTSIADYRPTRIFKEKLEEVTYICYKVDEDFFLKRVFELYSV